MNIYLIRHGLTQHNIEYRFGGISDVPVTPQGLAALTEAPFDPEKVYVSPLLRTRQTAAKIFPRSRQVVVHDLHEMNFGTFEGKNYNEMKNDPTFMKWIENKDDMEMICPGGETRAIYTKRVLAAFIQLVDEALAEGTERLMIVAHGGTQMVVMNELTTQPMAYHDGETCNGGCRLLRAKPELWRQTRKLELLDTLYFGPVPNAPVVKA